MRFIFALLLVCSALAGLQSSMAAEPAYQLKDGGSVTVDPATKRATVTRDGVTTPLYDGTHHTEDGKVLIIRQGVTTIPRDVPPAAPGPEVAAEQWEGAPIIGYSPCEQLVRKVCGNNNRCAQTEGCQLAWQLLDMETQERMASGSRNRMTFTSGQCIEATPDTEMFPACP
jgi:hypothetical protein